MKTPQSYVCNILANNCWKLVAEATTTRALDGKGRLNSQLWCFEGQVTAAHFACCKFVQSVANLKGNLAFWSAGVFTAFHQSSWSFRSSFWSADHTTWAAHLVKCRLGAFLRVMKAFKLLPASVDVTDGLGNGDGRINTGRFLELRPLRISRINACTL